MAPTIMHESGGRTGAPPRAKFAFELGTQASQSAPTILSDRQTGRLLYDENGSGNAPSAAIADIDHGLSLSDSSFIVV